MTVSRNELIRVIADFLEMGHIENILAMFRQEPEYYQLCGELISDERFMVRMGMAVLFEELASEKKANLVLAVPFLIPKLHDPQSHVRADAATLLGIIGTNEATEPLRELLNDKEPQVVEIVKDILEQG